MKVVLIAIIALLVPTFAVSTPTQWPADQGGNGHFYEKIEDYEINWFDAKNAAEALSWNGLFGHLVTISSESENIWIWTTFSGPSYYWLGAYQVEGSEEPDQGWEWVTGEEWVYSNWIPGEPNEAHSGENSMLFEPSYGGQWNDRVDWQPGIHGFIVEFEEAPVPTTLGTWGFIKRIYR